MKKVLLTAALLFMTLLFIGQKPKVEYPVWNWDPLTTERFADLYNNKWFGENTYYEAAITDITLMPAKVTDFVIGFPDSVTEVQKTDFYTDIVWYKDEGEMYAMNRWQDKVLISGLFGELERRVNTNPELAGELVHPLYLQDGRIRDEIYFNDDLLFKAEIQSIKIINKFAIVDSVNLYGYPSTQEVQWFSNDEMPGIASDGFYFLMYDCPTTDTCDWWFFGNQREKEVEKDINYPTHNHGWRSNDYGNNQNDNGGKKPLLHYTYGVGTINPLEWADQVYEGDLSDYAFCQYFNNEYSICLYITNIARASNAFTCVLSAGLERDVRGNHLALLFDYPSTFELHKQDNGAWIKLPPAPKPWFKQIINFQSEEKSSPKYYVNGEYIGEMKK